MQASLKPSRLLRAVLIWVLCVACILMVAGCGAASAGSLRVGFVGVGSSEGADQRAGESKTVSGMRQRGITVDYFAPKALDPQAQVNAAKRFIISGVNALVVAPQHTNQWTDTLASARAASVPVIFVGARPVAIEPSLYDTYLGPSYQAIGARLAQWASEAIRQAPGSAAIQDADALTVTVPLTTSASSEIASGWSNNEARTENIRDQGTVVATASLEQTETLVSRKLDALHTPPAFILAYGDTATSATLDVLKARGIPTAAGPSKGKVCVLSVGADREHSGETAVSVTWNRDYSAGLAKLVRTLVNGQTPLKSVRVPFTTTFAKEKE